LGSPHAGRIAAALFYLQPTYKSGSLIGWSELDGGSRPKQPKRRAMATRQLFPGAQWVAQWHFRMDEWQQFRFRHWFTFDLERNELMDE
jgi:hypothetical protein